MGFVENLQKIMTERNVTAYKIAHDLDIAQSTIGKWKSGEQSPTLDKLAKLTKYFNVSADYLIGFSPNPQGDTSESENLSADLVEYARLMSQLPSDKLPLVKAVIKSYLPEDNKKAAQNAQQEEEGHSG